MAAGGAVEALPTPLALMIREFLDASPADRLKLAATWGIRPGSPAAAALKVPATDADTTDGTA